MGMNERESGGREKDKKEKVGEEATSRNYSSSIGGLCISEVDA